MYSSSREEAVAAFDNLDTALNRVLKVSPDDLTIPECLILLGVGGKHGRHRRRHLIGTGGQQRHQIGRAHV